MIRDTETIHGIILVLCYGDVMGMGCLQARDPEVRLFQTTTNMVIIRGWPDVLVDMVAVSLY